ncbi:MAG: hypothetical protein QM714_05555 [Nocardioides sp.]|uniref:ABC transporter permease subunit n=1 Tax=Nocardioides sp. TaxID=35761 RepID=UPI0039E5287D
MTTSPVSSTAVTHQSGAWFSQITRWSVFRKRWFRLLLVVGGILLAYALPLLRPPIITTTDSDFGGVMVTAASYALVAVGLNIVIGYAGLLDLGYVGFYATGAYTTGVLTSQHWHWPFFFALPVAIAVTMVTGVILGSSDAAGAR